MACTSAIESRLSTSQFDTWKNQTTNDLNTLSSKNTLTPAELTQLSALETDIFNTIDCARAKISSIRASPTNVSNLQEQIVAIQKELDLKQSQYDVAKERALSISHPEEKTSDYEGWFPLGRPMRSSSLFILIGFSIFFTLFFFGLLMSLLGFQIQMSWIVPKLQTPGVQTGWWGIIMSWINPLTMAALIALIVTASFLLAK